VKRGLLDLGSDRQRPTVAEPMPDDVKETPALRDRKKARQRTELLQAAAELFREKGYERTRMEDIATLADVSTPTVYNYFSTKQGILAELLTQDRLEMQAPVEAVLRHPPEDPAEALAQLIHANMACLRRPEDKLLWREMLAAIVRAHDDEQGELDRNRSVFKDHIARLLQHFVDRGKISKAVPLPLAAELIYAVNAYDFRRLAEAEDRTPEMIRDIARDQMALLVAGWANLTPAAIPSTFAPNTKRKSRR
jgi:AcrR family transcriptional regulator